MCANSRLYVVLLLVFMAGVSGGSAGIINVPADQPSIQAGINAAIFGDEVVVAPGTYHERINFNGKSITVRSTDPDSAAVVAITTIDGDDGGSVVTFDNSETGSSVLAGFTITDGSATQGGGIYCYNSSPTIDGNAISDNQTTTLDGGGIYCRHGTPTITNNTISANTASSGGGIFCSDSTANIIGNSINGNYTRGTSSDGGGIYCYKGSPAITNNLISGNTAHAIASFYGRPTITNNTIVGNAGGIAIAAYYYSAGNPATFPITLTNNIIAWSTTEGIRLETGTPPYFRYCDVYGNNGSDYLGMTDPTSTNGNISADPLFADRAINDFRLKSVGGRWNGSAWVKDTVTSPCIDTGDPASAFANEPAPNGGRINIGHDGNTAYASKTPIPDVVRATPRHVGAANTLPFTTLFNVPMHRASVQSNLSISPAKIGAFSWIGRKLIFTPSTPWVPDRWYTVTIKRAARSTLGVKMAADFVWKFRTVAATAPALVTAAAIPTPAGAQITVNLSAAADVRVRIINMAGREVAVLPEQSLEAGMQTLLWNGRSASGTAAPPGQYLIGIGAKREGGAQSNVLVPLRK